MRRSVFETIKSKFRSDQESYESKKLNKNQQRFKLDYPYKENI